MSMRFILKTNLFPLILIMSIMIAFSKFIVSISGVILSLFEFLLSPYGLPKIAIWIIAYEKKFRTQTEAFLTKEKNYEYNKKEYDKLIKEY